MTGAPAWGGLPHVNRWLDLMARKDHRLWHLLASGRLTREQLRVHFEQEYVAYVRDFPVLLARVLGHGPPLDVRRSLAGNIYEEQVGGISRAGPHPALFLQQMAALGLDADAFERVVPLPATGAYRAVLDDATRHADWRVGYVAMCVFVEGSAREREALGLAPRTETLPDGVEAQVAAHPLVRHYGVRPEQMVLTRAHLQVEGGHRDDAWEAVTAHVRADADVAMVTAVLERCLAAWHAYRDSVAVTVGA